VVALACAWMNLLKLAQLQKIEVKLKRHKLIWNTVLGFANSGVLRGQMGAYSPERRHWGRVNTLCSHLKTCFKADT